MYDLECAVCFKEEQKCKCGILHDEMNSHYDEEDELDFGSEPSDEEYEEEELE